MQITGNTMIYNNGKGYYTSIGNKNTDGTYENMFISVNFKKGIELPNKTKINVKNGFMSFYKTKDGLPKLKIVITDFEEIKNENQTEEIEQFDLPF